MTDILDELRTQALRQTDTPAPEGARERAVEAALAAFDEEFAADERTAESTNTSRTAPGDRDMRDRWIQFARYGLAASFAAIVSAITLLILSNTPEAVDERRLYALDPNDVQELPLPNLREAMRERSAGTDRFPRADVNGVTDTLTDPVSTFSADVDTASYTFVRRLLNEGTLPPPAAVRTEEMLNYFSYAYEAPVLDMPLNADVALMPAPWSDGVQLLRIGIQGYEPPYKERPAANLVFLIDTSGSMSSPDRLPLLQSSLRLLLKELRPDDTVGIVAYAGSAGVVLEPTAASQRARIEDALRHLQAGGSTAGAAGIQGAYALAEAHYDAEKINRVILATDGDFNVGARDTATLRRLIERKRDAGVSLSVLGFGRGNLNDELMQALARNGDGQAAYIDSLHEAHKVLVEQLDGTLLTIAKEVKIQVEFNPAQVAEYRLLGYETRALNREDLDDDRVDAGEVGAGHQVTAMYEIVAPGSEGRRPDSPPSRGQVGAAVDDLLTDELAVVRIRYKAPGEYRSRQLDFPVTRAAEVAPDTEASRELAFAAAVAAFGQKLRADPTLSDYDYGSVMALAEANRGADGQQRREFVRLVELADELSR
ncbi:MAG: von Willebrand factor type A domain-containing protein [Pseudomonadota bacterium]